ncbi:MAG TPA: hypothetical protein VLB84_04240, partial [Bacteroidia bacterium]|nr:hypothetical protein [Bacteroidia bacterium]
PILLILAYEHIYTFLNRSVNYLFGLALIITNSIGLIVMGTTAGNSKMEIVKYIHDKYGEKPINLIQCTYTDVYDKHGGIIPYPEKQMSTTFIGNLCDINDSLFQPERENLLVTQKRNLLFKSCATLIPIKNFVLEKQSIFSWVEWLNERFYNGFDDLDVYVLYKKKY